MGGQMVYGLTKGPLTLTVSVNAAMTLAMLLSLKPMGLL